MRGSLRAKLQEHNSSRAALMVGQDCTGSSKTVPLNIQILLLLLALCTAVVRDVYLHNPTRLQGKASECAAL